MSALTNQPLNTSFLSPLGFRLQIKKTPHLNYFVQSATIPNVTIADVNVDTPFTRIPFPSTRVTFGNLVVTFKVDEDMKNYIELFNWITSLALVDDFEKHKALANQPSYSGEGLYSDISLIVLSSAKNPIHEVSFKDCFPIDLSELSFDSTSVDVEYLTATVTFANRKFTVTSI